MAQTDVETAVLKEQFKNLEDKLDDLKSLYKEIKESITTLTESFSSLRSDVNQANSRSMDNKIKISNIEKKLNEHEIKLQRNEAIRSLIIGVSSFLGGGGLITLISALASYFSSQ